MSWIAVAASVVGTVYAANAAGDAADAQVNASREANATQLKMFNQSRADQLPWMERGNQAGNLLSYYLGLPGSDAGGAGGGLAQYGLTTSAPTEQQFTRTMGTPGVAGERYTDYSGAWNRPPTPSTLTSQFDKAGFDKANATYQQQYSEALARQQAAQQGDPRFGSLLKPFTGASVATDPGYQFGLKQGEQTITNNRAALGSLLSGATLKDLTAYGNDYAGTKFNEAFQRDASTKNQINNFLAGQSGTGQNTATNLGQQSTTVGNQLGQNILGAGNARASGYVGAANAITGGISSTYGNYLNSQYLKNVMPQSSSYGMDGSQVYIDRGPTINE